MWDKNRHSHGGFILRATNQKYSLLVSTCMGPNSQRHSISDRTVKTGALLIAQIHGYLLGLKSIDSGSSKKLDLLAIISTILIINLH